MTLQPDSRTERPARTLAGPALVAVGVRELARDAGPLAWAAECADTVHVVHAFRQQLAGECSWDPIRQAREARRESARLLVARVVQRLHHSHPTLAVDGSAVPGDPVEVLVEFSEVVDLVVIGRDAAASCQTAARTVQRASCPVAVVPSGYRPRADDDRPVTLLMDGGTLPGEVLEVGLRQAARLRTCLCLAQFWSALHDEPPSSAELIADQQMQLDQQLAAVGRTDPEVPLASELLLRDDAQALDDLRSASQLLVLSASAVQLPRLLAPEPVERCPTLIVPPAA